MAEQLFKNVLLRNFLVTWVYQSLSVGRSVVGFNCAINLKQLIYGVFDETLPYSS